MTGYGKTFALMAAMTALFIGLGAMLGGATGAMLALVFAAGMNLFGYWNADKAVLRMAGAREVDAGSAPEFVGLVHRLADGAGMPRPKVYVIDTDQPNAFATGRNPQNAAVAATTGRIGRASAATSTRSMSANCWRRGAPTRRTGRSGSSCSASATRCSTSTARRP